MSNITAGWRPFPHLWLWSNMSFHSFKIEEWMLVPSANLPETAFPVNSYKDSKMHLPKSFRIPSNRKIPRLWFEVQIVIIFAIPRSLFVECINQFPFRKRCESKILLIISIPEMPIKQISTSLFVAIHTGKKKKELKTTDYSYPLHKYFPRAKKKKKRNYN